MAIRQAALFFFVLPTFLQGASYQPVTVKPPPPARELRGAWVATVSNIDWPSTNTLSVSQQKAELLLILDTAVRLRLNAIFLQVRSSCDALYASKLEPWSEYLTGTMGKAPQPFYDPLTYAIDQAHRRGIELHAWFNPYRARHQSGRSDVSPEHISKRRPDLVRRYGRQLWLDPGEKQVQEHSLAVVMDVVNRYDVDGVHFDDYFYPYKENGADGRELDFPDDASWKRYGAGNGLSREDWRRENVNRFIEKVGKSVKAAKPWVRFGVSPFGIWRPGNPPQIRGHDAYEKLYADARKWLNNGWVDYLAPQLYWTIDAPAQSFPVLLKWWESQNTQHRNLYAGLNSYNVGRAWNASEIVNQIRLAREQEGVTGHIHWNMRGGLMRQNGLQQALLAGPYARPAVPPGCVWLSKGAPPAPRLSVTTRGGGSRGIWAPPKEAKPRLWVVQSRARGTWQTEVLPARTSSRLWKSSAPDTVAVSYVDAYGTLSVPAVVQRRN